MTDLAQIDNVIMEYEHLWGCHGLPRRVSADLAGKYFEQWRRFNAAVISGSVPDIQIQSEGLAKAFKVLDAEARARGHEPTGAMMFEFKTPEGVAVGVVGEAIDRTQCGDYDGAVITVEELGRILDDARIDFTAAIKHFWPGATIKDVRRAQTKGEPFDDPITF